MTVFFGVFGAGLLASLSPCVYPLIPITVGYFGTQTESRKCLNIFIYACGQVFSFVAIGAFAVWAGETLGFSSESKEVNLTVGILLILAGVWSFFGKMPAVFYRLSIFKKVSGVLGSVKGPFGAFLLGAGSALVASPCTTPILGGILAMMASSATLIKGLFLMFFYALGFTSLFLALGLGLLNLKRLPKSGMWLQYLNRASSALLVIAGSYYIWKAV